jgi:hypothetical protein
MLDPHAYVRRFINKGAMGNTDVSGTVTDTSNSERVQATWTGTADSTLQVTVLESFGCRNSISIPQT